MCFIKQDLPAILSRFSKKNASAIFSMVVVRRARLHVLGQPGILTSAGIRIVASVHKRGWDKLVFQQKSSSFSSSRNSPFFLADSPTKTHLLPLFSDKNSITSAMASTDLHYYKHPH